LYDHRLSKRRPTEARCHPAVTVKGQVKDTVRFVASYGEGSTAAERDAACGHNAAIRAESQALYTVSPCCAYIRSDLAVGVEGIVQCAVCIVPRQCEVLPTCNEGVTTYHNLGVGLNGYCIGHFIAAKVGSLDAVAIEASIQGAIGVKSYQSEIFRGVRAQEATIARNDNLAIRMNRYRMSCVLAKRSLQINDQFAIPAEGRVRRAVGSITGYREVWYRRELRGVASHYHDLGVGLNGDGICLLIAPKVGGDFAITVECGIQRTIGVVPSYSEITLKAQAHCIPRDHNLPVRLYRNAFAG
jgi:hypothetical protein